MLFGKGEGANRLVKEVALAQTGIIQGRLRQYLLILI